MPTHQVLRIEQSAADKLVETVTRAQGEGSLEPLEPLIPEDAIDEEKHILRGRKYIVFGAEQKSLIGVGSLLRVGLMHKAAESVDLGTALDVAVQRARADAVPESEFSAVNKALDFDLGLPAGLSGDQGPSIVPDISAFSSGVERLLKTESIKVDDSLMADLRSLTELLGRIEPSETIVVLRS